MAICSRCCLRFGSPPNQNNQDQPASAFRTLPIDRGVGALKVQRCWTLISDELAISVESPAILAMTDFLNVIPHACAMADPFRPRHGVWETTAKEAKRWFSIDSTSPYIFVTRFVERTVLGVITLTDVSDARILEISASTGIASDDLAFGHVMRSIDTVRVISMDEIIQSRVGDVLATLEALGESLLLVSDTEPINGADVIRGVFYLPQVLQLITYGPPKAAL